MISPPSGLPVSISHTTTAITATVNPMRRESITQILRRDGQRREQDGSAACASRASIVGRMAAGHSRHGARLQFSQRRSSAVCARDARAVRTLPA
jgi:hypothetical protein